MDIKYTCAKWPKAEISIDTFLSEVDTDLFQGSEIFTTLDRNEAEEWGAKHKERGLDYIAQIGTEGTTLEAAIDHTLELFETAALSEPVLINSQTGRDYFTLDDNLKIFEALEQRSKEKGIRVCHETHRGRPTSSLLAISEIIDAFPSIEFTADVSHLMCVHESDLSNHEHYLEKMIPCVGHLHARVGFDQGPQVPNPFSDRYRPWLNRHMEIWRRIVKDLNDRKVETFYITPEFGPSPYLQYTPFEDKPLCDVWKLNEEIAAYLQKEL